MKIAIALKKALKEALKKRSVASFVLVALAVVLQAAAAQAAIKTQWIDYKQGNVAAIRLSHL